MLKDAGLPVARGTIARSAQEAQIVARAFFDLMGSHQITFHNIFIFIRWFLSLLDGGVTFLTSSSDLGDILAASVTRYFSRNPHRLHRPLIVELLPGPGDIVMKAQVLAGGRGKGKFTSGTALVFPRRSSIVERILLTSTFFPRYLFG